MKYVHKPSLFALLLGIAPAALAAPVAPGAGSILQQINPVTPPEPSSNQTGLRIERQGKGKMPTTAPFHVSEIRVTGNRQFDTATLHKLVADSEGRDLTLAQLDELALRITDFYHDHGFPLARAIIPAQTIRGGVVVMQVIEASYGKIRLDNKSRVKDSLIDATVSNLKGGNVIEQDSMNRSLLLLSDIPGLTVNATLLPGDQVGTSDLIIETDPGPAMIGNVDLDNYGNKYTGRIRAGGTVSFLNPLHHGDVLSLTGLSSGSGMNYGRGSYDMIVNGKGTHLGVSFSALHYILGDVLTSLNGHGTAQVSSAWAKQPLLRTRDLNLYGQVQFDHLVLKDHIDASAIRTDRHLDNWTGSVTGDARNIGGISTWNVSWTSGQLAFDDGTAGQLDAATARTQGSFSKWNVNLARLQSLGGNTVLYVSLAGQWANGNLDPSQQMTAGGPYTVRAYDMGVLSGDDGYLGSVEIRHDLAYFHGKWQLVGFYDSQHVIVNKNPWTPGVNSATLSGAGLGLNWMGAKEWSVRTYVAARTGSASSVLLPNSSSSRVWVEVGKGF